MTKTEPRAVLEENLGHGACRISVQGHDADQNIGSFQVFISVTDRTCGG